MYTFPSPPDLDLTLQWIGWIVTVIALWKAQSAKQRVNAAEQRMNEHGRSIQSLQDKAIDPSFVAAAMVSDPTIINQAVADGKADLASHAESLKASLLKTPINVNTTASFTVADVLDKHALMQQAQQKGGAS